jgi:hypothetical protein
MMASYDNVMRESAGEIREASVNDDIERIKKSTHQVWAEAKERLDHAEAQVSRARREFTDIDEFYSPMVGPQPQKSDSIAKY